MSAVTLSSNPLSLSCVDYDDNTKLDATKTLENGRKSRKKPAFGFYLSYIFMNSPHEQV